VNTTAQKPFENLKPLAHIPEKLKHPISLYTEISEWLYRLGYWTDNVLCNYLKLLGVCRTLGLVRCSEIMERSGRCLVSYMKAYSNDPCSGVAWLNEDRNFLALLTNTSKSGERHLYT